MVHLLQRNYPGGKLLQVYDRSDRSAPEPTPQAFAAYLAALDPERWEQVLCLAGHSVNFAIPVLTEPFRVFTIVRDPVERVVSLFHYLKGRDGFGERGGLAGQLIRNRGWSLADIYRNFGGAVPIEKGEHQLFAGFFNGQARTILAPHFPTDRVRMGEGRPESPPGLMEGLDWVLSEHYLLGSAARYEASVARFAAEFGWHDTTVMRDNVTEGRPELDDLPGEVLEMVRAYNALDDELHQRALAELAEIADPPSPSPAGNGARGPANMISTDVTVLTEQLREREQAAARSAQAALRSEQARVQAEQSLAETERERRALDARIQRYEQELDRVHENLTRAENALSADRIELSRLRGVSAVRDRRLRALGRQLKAREQTLAEARQAHRELDARARQRDQELTELQNLLGGLLEAGRRVATELGMSITASGEAVPEQGVALLETTLERARLALSAAARESRELGEQLETRTRMGEATAERERRLAASVSALERKLALARAEVDNHAETVRWLLEERRVLVRHARGLAASRAWRYGHRASRVLRRMVFRPGKKREGAAEVLLGMLEAPPQLPVGHTEEPRV